MTRTIKELRILPPFAIARLGSADDPMDNYTIELDAPANQDRPLGYQLPDFAELLRARFFIGNHHLF